MKAEIIAVGTELLLGQVVNTNAATISEYLADLGIDVYYHVTVGDNAERLTEAIIQAEQRSDLLIFVGGLGPTEDDLTKQVLAKHLSDELVVEAQAEEELTNYFAKTGRKRTPNNERQTLIFQNATPLANRVGLAVGAFLEKYGRYYVVLPGPPSELKPMLTEELYPLLANVQEEGGQKIHVRVLRFYGIGESQLTEKLAEIIQNQTSPTIATYAKPLEVTLRLAVKSVSEVEAIRQLDELEQRILSTEEVADYFYGYGDDNSLANVVVCLLREKGKTITAAESLTAGLFQSTLGEVNGVSEVFKGGFITYSLEMKSKILGISEASLLEEGTVSGFAARMMSESARKFAHADVALSFTGVAGPDLLEGKSVGEVWIGLARRGKSSVVDCVHFHKDRQYIREAAVMYGLNLLRRELLGELD